MSNGLWRLTRNDVTIRLYERLKRAGVTGTRMREYVADLSDPDVVAAYESRSLPADVSATVVDAAGLPDAPADFDDPSPEDVAVVARTTGGADATGRIVGYLFVSDRPIRVDALETDLTFGGAYVWRVYVDPDQRQRGIATALVARACRHARDEGHETAHALIALDNRPSQWTFDACGFEPVREVSYYRVGRWTRRSSSSV